MANSLDNIDELHWTLGILQHLDVGLVVLDADHNICLWNGFMENHSGKKTYEVFEKNVFQLFSEIPDVWLKHTIDSVFTLKNRAFSTWQQRPYIFKFKSYRAITGHSEWMYQNITIIPLTSADGIVRHVCLILYDVTDSALDEQTLERTNAELGHLSRTDGLTGLLNRRAWQEYLSMEHKRYTRTDKQAVLVMLDIDHFKKVNDTYGHQAGDAVICSIASTLGFVKRETDYAGRYGGEEFGVILLATGYEGAMIFADRLHKAIASTDVVYENQQINYTVSVGLAEAGDANDCIEWLSHADQALYKAKESGRNCTVIFDSRVLTKTADSTLKCITT